MKYPILILFLVAGFSACQEEVTIETESGEALIFSELYHDDQIASEFFEINCQRDTTLRSKNGVGIRIYSNSFATKDSAEVSGSVSIELKEAFKPIDFVLGNLTTTSNNQILTSGGMMYLNATSNEQELILKEGSEIGFMVPNTSVDEDMMIFSGARDTSNLIDWKAPEPILNAKLQSLERQFISITYQYIGAFDANDQTFQDWLWKPARKVGDKTTIDGQVIKVIDIAKDFARLRESENGLFIPEVITNKGQNGFVTDYNTSYIFSVKKLGWANIDKLFSDPRSEAVQMLATIDNQHEFGFVFTTLLLPGENMYLPGYQKNDNSFGFSHNDSEQPILPIGAKAMIMATAYKDDKPYFNIKTITIERNMNISFALNATTPEGLKRALEENI